MIAIWKTKTSRLPGVGCRKSALAGICRNLWSLLGNLNGCHSTRIRHCLLPANIAMLEKQARQ